MNKKTITAWEQLFADQKDTLMLYSFCHQFVSLVFEGDELYTIENKRTNPADSEGWTVVIMERSSRFIADQQCGTKDAKLFKSVMQTVCDYIAQTDDFTFFSDGECRYGNTLFSFCAVLGFYHSASVKKHNMKYFTKPQRYNILRVGIVGAQYPLTALKQNHNNTARSLAYFQVNTDSKTETVRLGSRPQVL